MSCIIPSLTEIGSKDSKCKPMLNSNSSRLGFVHPLQDVALHQCLPLSSIAFLLQVAPSFSVMSSRHLLLGRPLDIFPLPGCHSVQCLIHLMSFILAIWPAHFHFCFSVYSMASVIFVLLLISQHGILSCSYRSNSNKKSKCSNNPYAPYLQDFFAVTSFT